MATPLAVDQFSRYMASLFDERKIIQVSTAGLSFFGRPEHMSETHYETDAKVVDIDIIRATDRVAALIHRGTNSTHMGDLESKNKAENFSSFSRVYPLAEEESSINADQILNRIAGEGAYSRQDRQARMRYLALNYHMEHIRKFVRLFEFLAWSSILTGQQPAIIGTTNADLVYDFRRNASLFITPAAPWDQAGANILGDIDGGAYQLEITGHVSPNVLLMPGDVSSALVNDATIKEFANILNFHFVSVGPSNPIPANLAPLVAGGAIARGLIITPQGREIWLLTYLRTYTDRTGTTRKYLPDGMAVLAYYGARCDRYFGPPELLPPTGAKSAWYADMFGFDMLAPPMPTNIKNAGAVVDPRMFYSSAFEVDDKKVSLKTQTAPIFSTTQTDSFVVFSGLTGAGSES